MTFFGQSKLKKKTERHGHLKVTREIHSEITIPTGTSDTAQEEPIQNTLFWQILFSS